MLNLFQHPTIGTLAQMQPARDPIVYILASRPYGTLYIGVTSDLVRRLHLHRTRASPGFTSKYGVNRLVRFEQFGDMERAILREKQLKRWHRQWKINLIESENPDWHDLAPGLGFEPIAPRTGLDGS
ncbi:GIY-YIG nuclease family protein [Alteriqipengyuania flavescens]|uniref:GIY-YIG nuclease family protein n=1 Tax=Alteriqipengyuania flavescens TaxID=3053610 RepID=UPI0025B60F98|nr:GIY-YIG nuclease family protein [Alteriqipengyuania flavescens]WJY17469.1 GIY-YIG nuclease family protein [Alteriqipengyuania flavescens]WJY23412.1 GIY-YIG nuclease family protein [Alteriqipengyuania flavescens]